MSYDTSMTLCQASLTSASLSSLCAAISPASVWLSTQPSERVRRGVDSGVVWGLSPCIIRTGKPSLSLSLSSSLRGSPSLRLHVRSSSVAYARRHHSRLALLGIAPCSAGVRLSTQGRYVRLHSVLRLNSGVIPRHYSSCVMQGKCPAASGARSHAASLCRLPHLA